MKTDYLENAFITLGFLFLSGALVHLQIFPYIVISLTTWTVAFGSSLLALARIKQFLKKSRRDIFIVIVIFLVFSSLAWSLNPAYSFALIKGTFFPMTSYGLYLGISFDIKTLMRKLGYALIIGLLLCWLTGAFFPSIGIDQIKFLGAWKGVYGHKNETSSYMVLTALVLILSSLRRTPEKWLGFPRHVVLRYLGISAFIYIFLTTSGTGLALSIIITGALIFYSRFTWQGKVTVFWLELAVIFLIPIAVGWQAIVIAMGKDPTLSSRTIFWDFAIDAVVNQRPLLGFGKGAFWVSENVGRIVRAFDGGYIPPHAHNGFIEIALDLGLVGIGLFLISCLLTWRKCLLHSYRVSDPEDLFPLGFMILFTLNNMTESLTVYNYSIFWPIYIALALNAGYGSSSKLWVRDQVSFKRLQKAV